MCGSPQYLCWHGWYGLPPGRPYRPCQRTKGLSSPCAAGATRWPPRPWPHSVHAVRLMSNGNMCILSHMSLRFVSKEPVNNMIAFIHRNNGLGLGASPYQNHTCCEVTLRPVDISAAAFFLTDDCLITGDPLYKLTDLHTTLQCTTKPHTTLRLGGVQGCVQLGGVLQGCVMCPLGCHNSSQLYHVYIGITQTTQEQLKSE